MPVLQRCHSRPGCVRTVGSASATATSVVRVSPRARSAWRQWTGALASKLRYPCPSRRCSPSPWSSSLGQCPSRAVAALWGHRALVLVLSGFAARRTGRAGSPSQPPMPAAGGLRSGMRVWFIASSVMLGMPAIGVLACGRLVKTVHKVFAREICSVLAVMGRPIITVFAWGRPVARMSPLVGPTVTVMIARTMFVLIGARVLGDTAQVGTHRGAVLETTRQVAMTPFLHVADVAGGIRSELQQQRSLAGVHLSGQSLVAPRPRQH
mmetsp:Transcript_141605/g.452846  ORF Transcript_141605/g.452846 Transcript_141605/m.452846 type:complete len:266 (+) Transcript_141605:860-1657(+)